MVRAVEVLVGGGAEICSTMAGWLAGWGTPRIVRSPFVVADVVKVGGRADLLVLVAIVRGLAPHTTSR